MILNRIGDFGLVLGILIIFVEFKAVDYATVFAVTTIFTNKFFNFLNFDFDLISIICFFLFIGAVGKSAQLGLHTWLPDAMEGPTPVSALIHAATIVTAGVFLIVRTSTLFEHTPSMLSLVSIIGACTAFFAATVGLLQNDLKRVIAYSTCSQLGYMIFACGLSNYSVGVFHLVNHAFFKALLFLGAGFIIHAVADEQDMRKMGGLKRLILFTYSMVVIGLIKTDDFGILLILDARWFFVIYTLGTIGFFYLVFIDICKMWEKLTIAYKVILISILLFIFLYLILNKNFLQFGILLGDIIFFILEKLKLVYVTQCDRPDLTEAEFLVELDNMRAKGLVSQKFSQGVKKGFFQQKEASTHTV